MSLKDTEVLLKDKSKFIFVGEEAYLAKRFIDKLKAELNPDFLMFNYIEVEQEKESLEELLMKIEAVPMMDAKKLVHIRNFNYAIEGNVWSKKEIEDFEASISKLAHDTKIIISNDQVQKPGGLGIYKRLSKVMTLIKLDRLGQAEQIAFVEEIFRFKLKDKTPSKEVVNELIKISGYNNKNSKTSLFDLDDMVIKTAVFFEERGFIEVDDLRHLFKQREEPDIFRLLNAIRDEDKPRAFKEFYLLRENGEASIKTMITLAKILSTMVKSSYYFAEGYKAEDIASELGKNPYTIKSGHVFIRKFGRSKLIDMVDQIVEIDYRLKTGAIEEDLYGDLALMRIFDIIEQ